MADDLRALYDGCYRRLVAQVYAVTADISEAQDAVQEAFVRALAAPRMFGRVDNPEAWLRAVAVNVARRRYRRRSHLDRLLRRTPPRPAIEPEDLTPDHVALVAALRRLPAAQREAVALHHLTDLPVAEVAELTGVAVGTVKARLSRGRAKLAELLADEPAGAEPPSPDGPPAGSAATGAEPAGPGPAGSGLVRPGAARPLGTGPSEPGQPGQPGAGLPGQPGAGQPGAGQPGAGQPGAGRRARLVAGNRQSWEVGRPDA